MATPMLLATASRPAARFVPSCRPRRALLTVTAAAGSADFSAEQLQAGLEHQRASAGSVQAEAASEVASRVPKKKASRREERAAAAAAAADAEVAARQQSEETQRQLSQRALDSADVIAAALRTQLRQSGTFDEAAPETASGSADDAAAEPAAESPGTVLEDGSIMFKF